VPGLPHHHTGYKLPFALSRAKQWRHKEGWYAHCPGGYPVRSRDLRDRVFNGFINNDHEAREDAYIYCETEVGGGHVYFGTFETCVVGNGLPASKMSSCAIFNRYANAK
jgi:hypothetical protein